MAARYLARHVDAFLCISPASNAAWSVAPNTQSFGLSSDHTSMTDLQSQQLHDFKIHTLQKFYSNDFSYIHGI